MRPLLLQNLQLLALKQCFTLTLSLHLLKLLFDLIDFAFERVTNNFGLIILEPDHLKQLIELKPIIQKITSLIVHSVLKEDIKTEKWGYLCFHSLDWLIGVLENILIFCGLCLIWLWWGLTFRNLSS